MKAISYYDVILIFIPLLYSIGTLYAYMSEIPIQLSMLVSSSISLVLILYSLFYKTPSATQDSQKRPTSF